MRSDVVALYVDPRGPYPKLVAEWWDAKRDARLYDGPLPVVAHPPCGPWSSLRHLHSKDAMADMSCGARAVDQVQRFGGVLEQPKGSKLFECYGLPPPGKQDHLGGYTIEVDQCAWGHVARKTTWLYVVGVPFMLIQGSVKTGGTPTHWCSGGRTKRPGMGATVPPGIKVCSRQQRNRTPVAFAEWLLWIAGRCRSRARVLRELERTGASR